MKKSLLVKFLIMALALVFVFTLASCDKEEEEDGGVEYENKEELADMAKVWCNNRYHLRMVVQSD